MQSYKTFSNGKDNTNLKVQLVLQGLIMIIAPILVLAISLAWVFYPEKYLFFQEYISQLGAYFSVNSIANLTASIIFTTGFCVCGAIFLVIAIIYFVKKKLEHNVLKGIFSLVMAIGAVLTAIPTDHPSISILHGIGAGLFIFGFGILNFILQMMRFTRKHHPRKPEKTPGFYRDLAVTIIVLITFIVFLVFYILKVLTSNTTLQLLAIISQKGILIVDCIAIFFIDTDDM